MANPTTNYGWPMPTATDLVTDLPADFAAFGQPVDTSLKALNPETTLGDIAYRSSTSNTNTRLGIGSTGQVLTVASGLPSWATPAGGSKVVQIIAATTTTAVSNSTSTFADTTLTATITPTSATNKVLVFVSQNGIQKGTSDTALDLKLLRASTSLGYIEGLLKTNDTGAISASCSLSILDSPATTSATIYKTQFMSQGNSAAVAVQQYVSSQTTTSTIILMEVTP